MAKEKNNKLQQYELDISKEKEKIEEKIKILEKRILSYSLKEEIINDIINKLNIELQNADSKAFKLISQLRTSLNKNFEALNLITDMILKTEDLIFKYRKMLVDIENQKVNNYIKLLKETSDTENDVTKILMQINQQFNEIKNTDNPLVHEALKELEEQGY